MKMRNMNKKAKIGIALFITMCIFTIGGSMLIPFEPYAYESVLANQSPSQSYLDVPKLTTDDVIDIASTTTFSAALHKDGSVIMWGDDTVDFSLINDLKITNLAAGTHHMVFADSKHDIYTMEDNAFQQDESAKASMKRIEEEGILKLVASDDYSGCLTNDGNLYVWGNTNFMNNKKIPEEFQTHIIDVEASSNALMLRLDDHRIVMVGADGLSMKNIPTVLANGEIDIIDMAVNYHNAAVIDDNGNLMVWGEDENDLLNAPIEGRYEKIEAGRHSFHVVDNNKTVTSWGSTSYHETSMHTYEQVDEIFSSNFQTYIVSSDKIEGWGHAGFVLGSDHLGRDVLSRLIHGGAITMFLGMIACIISTILGTIIGLLCGYKGGLLDHLCMRFAEIITSIPFLPIVLTLSAFLSYDSSIHSRMIFIMILYGCLSWVSLARLVRSNVIKERHLDYVLSAKTLGASTSRIIFKHLLPSCMPLILSDITLMYAGTMLMEAGLSFLGFGVPSPYPSWGNMLESAQNLTTIQNYPWTWLPPAICIFLSVYALHLLQDALRKEWNPKEEQ